MKGFIKGALFLLITVLVTCFAFAQVVADPISNADALQQIMALFGSGSLKGLSLVAAVIQGLMLLLRSDFVVQKIGAAKASLRLALVLMLSLIGGIVALRMQGMDLKAALIHSSSLAAYQVLFHQLYTVYLESKKA